MVTSECEEKHMMEEAKIIALKESVLEDNDKDAQLQKAYSLLSE